MAANPYPRKLAAALLGLALCCALGAATAQAKTVSVSGTQTVVDENAGTYRMHGDLVGGWKITSFKELATAPLYQGKGTERFRGCLDRGHDGGCAGDPKGKLFLRFRYWALFGSDDSLRAAALASDRQRDRCVRRRPRLLPDARCADGHGRRDDVRRTDPDERANRRHGLAAELRLVEAPKKVVNIEGVVPGG
jgi:hypothetical protein